MLGGKHRQQANCRAAEDEWSDDENDEKLDERQSRVISGALVQANVH
jgi:hypothetical protein